MNYFIYNNKNQNQFVQKIVTETPPTNLASTTVEYPVTNNGYIRCFNTQTNTWGQEIKNYKGTVIYYTKNSLNTQICDSIELPIGYTNITPPDFSISYSFNSLKQQWTVANLINSDSTPNNVTKFQVYANSEIIPAGTNVSDLSTSYAVAVEIPVGMTHEFKLDLIGSISESDVTIDWGDGTITQVATCSSNTFSHTYITTGKYCITITGENYNRLRSTTSDKNLICRIFGTDLPTTAKLRKASSLCSGALRLIEVDCTFNDTFTKLTNFPYLFLNCQNLRKAVGFPVLTYVESVERNIFKLP